MVAKSKQYAPGEEKGYQEGKQVGYHEGRGEARSLVSHPGQPAVRGDACTRGSVVSAQRCLSLRNGGRPGMQRVRE